ncbi:hypothetical protein UFOVP142_57 [uncultured Caudovirales phage]|uniref:Uncharacterized protein n=1 Tax=uncultured Caudovirales phage TaxID=2100421 RepID=A0A6J7XJU3_9CAUD|nr:hypothetical protein UFOVP142_57 [uncultured Caudovirales phage]
MNRSTWKKREAKAAKAFGARRQVGSGSLGRSDRSRSDSTHEKLFLECKHSKRHAVITLWDKTHEYAKREGKTPVVVLSVMGRPGCWYLVKDTDLEAVAEERKSGTVGGKGDVDETGGDGEGGQGGDIAPQH